MLLGGTSLFIQQNSKQVEESSEHGDFSFDQFCQTQQDPTSWWNTSGFNVGSENGGRTMSIDSDSEWAKGYNSVNVQPITSSETPYPTLYCPFYLKICGITSIYLDLFSSYHKYRYTKDILQTFTP